MHVLRRRAGYLGGVDDRMDTVALDCVEIDQLAPLADVVAAQDLADRISAMLTKLIRSAVPERP